MISSKETKYKNIRKEIMAVLEGESNMIARYSTVVCLLSSAFDYFYWTGFYRMIDGELVVGPYQGTPACLRIAVGKGVCGTAAETGETQVVADVHTFPGHIACDAASASEIVIPVKVGEEIIAVLDIDSTVKSSFDDIDADHLERMVAYFFS